MKRKIVLLAFVLVLLSAIPITQLVTPVRSSGTTIYTDGVSAQLADTPWPMFRHDPKHTGRSPFLGAQAANLKWTFATGDLVESSPAIATDGTIYVGSHDGKIYAINPDGTLKWSYTTGGAVTSSPAIGSDGTIYVGSRDDKVYAINPNGTLKWSYTTISDVHSSPAIDPTSGIIYLAATYDASWYGRMYAFYPNGTLKWVFNPGTSGSWIYSSPAIREDGVILFGDFTNPNATFWALNPNGTVLWSTTIPRPDGQTDIYSSAAIGMNGTIYFGGGHDDRKLYALHPNGTIAWSYLTGSLIDSSPAIGKDGTIYVGSSDGKLYAINPKGTLKWTYITGGGVVSSPAIGADGTIYVGSYDSNIYAINPDGTLKWSYNTGGAVHSSPAIGSDGTMYVGSNDGKLYAIGGLEVHDVAVTNITPSKTVVGQGYSMPINVTVENQGDYTETFNVTLCANSGLVNDTSLVCYWKFDEGSGVIAHDSTGNGNDGTLYQGLNTGWTTGKFGKALKFDGIDDYIWSSGSPQIDITDAITIMAWVKPQPTTSFNRIVTKGDEHYVLRLPEMNTIHFYMRKGVLYHTTADYTFIPGEWYHVAVTWAGYADAYPKVYVNAKPVTPFQNEPVTPPIDSDNAGISISGFDSTETFNGTLDEIKIYNRALSRAEIWTEYIGTPIQTQATTLQSRETKNLTFTWNTTGFAEGNYTISAYAWPVPGETDTADNTYINGWVVVTCMHACISPTSASILVGQSVTFTSTVSGGYTPYNYQWYLNGAPVSGATSASWMFTPTTSGIYYVHLKVTDAKANTTQSDTARITAATVPVGGYSIPIHVETKTEPVLPYIALIATLTAVFTKLRPKTKRKH